MRSLACRLGRVGLGARARGLERLPPRRRRTAPARPGRRAAAGAPGPGHVHALGDGEALARGRLADPLQVPLPMSPVPGAILLGALAVAALLAGTLRRSQRSHCCSSRLSPGTVAASACVSTCRRDLERALRCSCSGRCSASRVIACSGKARMSLCSARSTSRRRGAVRRRAQRPATDRSSVSRSPRTRSCSTTTGCFASASVARRSALAVALATRLVPTLERDAQGCRGAAGPGVAVDGRARTRAAALAARRGLARARREPRRGYGGTRVRPGRRDARAAARLARARPGRRRRRRALVVAAVLWL